MIHYNYRQPFPIAFLDWREDSPGTSLVILFLLNSIAALPSFLCAFAILALNSLYSSKLTSTFSSALSDLCKSFRSKFGAGPGAAPLFEKEPGAAPEEDAPPGEEGPLLERAIALAAAAAKAACSGVR